jgi:hypothetical protein
MYRSSLRDRLAGKLTPENVTVPSIAGARSLVDRSPVVDVLLGSNAEANACLSTLGAINMTTISNETKLLFTSKSGHQYEFYRYPLNVTFKAVPGIYIWVKQTKPGSYRPLYIGQSQDLSDRHSGGHHKEDDVRLGGATHICALATSGTPAQRLLQERDLIESYKPDFNET